MSSMFNTLIRTITQFWPPPSQWSTDDIPDLEGKVVLVTGGNGGIGKEIIKHLLRKNAKVYLAARSRSKAEEAIRELAAETSRVAEFLELDLGDLEKVKKSAEEFKKRERRLDVLFLNAGVMHPPLEQFTAQGYDMTFGTNVIGHFLLLKLLYPMLVSSTSPDSPSRIVWTASSAHYYAEMDYRTMRDDPERQKRGKFWLYAQSKFAQVMLAYRMAKQCEEDGVVTSAVDPGNIRTEVLRSMPLLTKILMYSGQWPIRYGGLTPLYAGVSPESAKNNGNYFRPWARLGEPNEKVKDPVEQQKLWDYLENEVKPYL